MKNYIGSQEHWEDSINADYEYKKRMEKEQEDNREQEDDRQPETQSCQTSVMVSVDFEKFKDNFLFAFVFKQIERPNFNDFLMIHFKVYNIVYKNIYTVQEYAKIALHEELNEFEIFGMQLK